MPERAWAYFSSMRLRARLVWGSPEEPIKPRLSVSSLKVGVDSSRISSGFPVSADTRPCKQLSNQRLPHDIFLCDWVQDSLHDLLGTGGLDYQRIVLTSCWKRTKHGGQEEFVVLPPKQLSNAVFGSHSASFIQDLHVSLMGDWSAPWVRVHSTSAAITHSCADTTHHVESTAKGPGGFKIG